MIPMTSSGMPTSHQGQQGAESGRGQSRNDGERMDRALVQHAEDEVDRDQRREDQDRSAAERTLERLGVSLEAGGDRRRHVKICRGLFYRRHRRTDGTGRREIETRRHRRWLIASGAIEGLTVAN